VAIIEAPVPFKISPTALEPSAYLLGVDGWLSGARRCASPNYNLRPDAVDISLLVIHNISLPPAQFGGGWVERFFCNQLPPEQHPYFTEIAALQVSSHFFIDRQGCVTQFVATGARAWHAGASEFGPRDNCNDFSLGIEMEGTDLDEYTDEQYISLVELSACLMRSYPEITLQRIVGHCDIAPGRKTDPGQAFDWPRYRAALTQRQGAR